MMGLGLPKRAVRSPPARVFRELHLLEVWLET